MTSAVVGGRGHPKSRGKEQGCINSVCDKGGGSSIIRTFCGRHIWKPPTLNNRFHLLKAHFLRPRVTGVAFMPAAASRETRWRRRGKDPSDLT